jgi:hypothetical protein
MILINVFRSKLTIWKISESQNDRGIIYFNRSKDTTHWVLVSGRIICHIEPRRKPPEVARPELSIQTQVIKSTDFSNLWGVRLACMKVVDSCYVVYENDSWPIRPGIIPDGDENSDSFKKMDLSLPRKKQRTD